MDRTEEQLVPNTENQAQKFYWRDRGVTTGAQVEMFQAQCYAEYFKVFRKYSNNIERVTFWGLRDNYNWRRNHNPLLWNSDFSSKAAFLASWTRMSSLNASTYGIIPNSSPLRKK